jgi:hypothetical protein
MINEHLRVRHWWLMPVILLRRQRSGGSLFKAIPGKQFVRPYLEKPFTKIGAVEWLKVKTLISSPKICGPLTVQGAEQVHTQHKQPSHFSFTQWGNC